MKKIFDTEKYHSYFLYMSVYVHKCMCLSVFVQSKYHNIIISNII